MSDQALMDFITKAVVGPLSQLTSDMAIVKSKMEKYWGIDFSAGGSTKQSPRALSSLGLLVEKDLREENASLDTFLMSECKIINTNLINQQLDKTPYNIQNECFARFNSHAYNDDPFLRKSFEKVAYNHGNDIVLIKEVLSILLRDHYLKEWTHE